MDDVELRKLGRVEQRHWWYAERRAVVRRLVKPLTPGRALDVGCGGGGNTAVLRELGWDVTGVEYSPVAVELARSRGLGVTRADARRLPVRSESMDLVMSTDLWEHVEDDESAAAETFRVLKPGGRALVAVPCDQELWSGHDVAVGHLRRYEREELVKLITHAGLEVVDVRSWNVLLRPIVKLHRRTNTDQSDLDDINPLVNAGLRTVVAAERVLPLHRRPGVSLFVRAVRPLR